ncbi:MAG: AAA family ATPase [Pseudomonadota bacterium]
MPDLRRGDQAAGLRRLFGEAESQVVTFAAGGIGVGKTLAVINLATALAQQGKEVLVFDECTHRNLALLSGVSAPYDLLDVINQSVSLDAALLSTAPGVRVLPAARALKVLGKLNEPQQRKLVQSVCQIARPADIILVDAALDHPLGFSPLALAAQDTVIVMSTSGASITDAYKLIKKMSLGYARKQFHILLSKVRDQHEAQAIYRNMSQVARSRSLARLDYAGHVPFDEHLRQASMLLQPVVSLFPQAPSAQAYSALATTLLHCFSPDGEPGGLERFVRQWLHLSQNIDAAAVPV